MALRPANFAIAATALLVAAAALPRSGHGEVRCERNVCSSGEIGIEAVFPIDWSVSAQASYPGLLALAVERTLGGKMTLAVDELRDNETLGDCVQRNAEAMTRVRFKVKAQPQHPTGAMVLQAEAPGGRMQVRQAYRSFGGRRVYVLTLAAPRETMQRYVRPFDDTLRSLNHIGGPAVPVPTAPADPDAE